MMLDASLGLYIENFNVIFKVNNRFHIEFSAMESPLNLDLSQLLIKEIINNN